MQKNLLFWLVIGVVVAGVVFVAIDRGGPQGSPEPTASESVSPSPSSTTGAKILPKITSFAPTSGAVGTSVTVYGMEFNGITNVRFNGVNAGIGSRTGTSITVVVPPGATTGKISVTTAAGTATSVGAFTVTLPSTPTPTPTPSTTPTPTPTPVTIGFSSALYHVDEDMGPAVIRILLNGSANEAVTVKYETRIGTAKSSDYTQTSGTLTFPVGTTTRTFSITIHNENDQEEDEEFTLMLEDVTGPAQPGIMEATVTIRDDDTN